MSKNELTSWKLEGSNGPSPRWVRFWRASGLDAAVARPSGSWMVWPDLSPRTVESCIESGLADKTGFDARLAKAAADAALARAFPDACAPDAALVRHGLATMSKEEAGPPVKPSLPPTEGRWVSADDVRVAPLGDAPSPPAGRKDDEGKDRWDLLPWKEVGEVVAVLTFGAEHYGTDNWKAVPAPRRRYVAAVMRHVVAWQTGERTDATTGRSHLAHAVACLLFLMWFDNNSAKAHNEGEKP